MGTFVQFNRIEWTIYSAVQWKGSEGRSGQERELSSDDNRKGKHRAARIECTIIYCRSFIIFLYKATLRDQKPTAIHRAEKRLV